jgi:uncharacterized membrane protein YagU involved in acid resistance
MVPFGLAFRAADMRVGHYGPKFAALYMDDPSPLAMFVQHLVIGWASALPFLWLLDRFPARVSPVVAGVLYGVAYYVAINSLALPLAFGDPLPWQLGIATIVPSLTVHVAFGLSLGITGARLLRDNRGNS